MKKIMAMLLCIILLFATACSNTDSEKVDANDKEKVTDNKGEDNTNETSSEDNNGLTETGTYPIVDEQLTFKIFGRHEANMEDIETNEFTQYLENKTNIHIDWQTTPDDSLWDKMNIVIASDDLPDAFMNVWLGPIHEETFGVQEGVLIQLDDLIDEHMPNLKKRIEEHKYLKGFITASDGHIYGLPGVIENYHIEYQLKMWMNTYQLDQLGLEMPTTTDEFYEVLKTFKEKMPDAVPLSGATNGWNTNVDSFLMNSFITDTGMYNGMRTYVEDGVLDTSVNKEGYRDGLSYLNKLYSEGLLDSAAFTQQTDQLKTLVASPGEPVLAVPGGQKEGQFISVSATPELYAHYEALTPLIGPSGLQQTAIIPSYPYGIMFAITKDCENPEALARWADSFYDFDVQMSKSLGVKGREWVEAEEGEVGLTGKPARYKVISTIDQSQMQNTVWGQNGIFFTPLDWALSKAVDPTVDKDTLEGNDQLTYDVTKEQYEPYSSEKRNIINPPPLKFTAEENEELGAISAELQGYVNESKVAFIMGAMSLEDDWDDYVANLNSIGLERYIELCQAAYSRMFPE